MARALALLIWGQPYAVSEVGPTVGNKKKKKICFPAEQIEHFPAFCSSCCKWHENDDFLSMPEQSINRMLFLQENSHALVVAYIKLSANVFLC